MSRRAALLPVLAAIVAVMLVPACLQAATVRIPLEIDYPLLDEAIRSQLYAHGGRAWLWNGDNACQYLYAEHPAAGPGRDALQIDTRGHLSVGVAVGNKCLDAISWTGIVELTAVPRLAGFALKLRITDVNLYEENHRKSLLVGRGFDLIKNNIIPPFETFSFDLGPSMRELATLARLAAGPGAAAQIDHSVSTLRLEPVVKVTGQGLRLVLEIDIPVEPRAPAEVSSAPLKPEEVAAWRAALDNWDAFLVFVIKQVAATVPEPAVRSALFNILLDSRERLVSALAQPQHASGPDPVRLLFLDEWTRLHNVIEAAAAQNRLGNRAFEFLSFVSAGDALFALDQAAPALGIRISAGDLRRLARIMAPEARGDPLVYSFEEDPELRKLFGLSAPLQMPGKLGLPPEAAPRDLQPKPPPHAAAPTAGVSRGVPAFQKVDYLTSRMPTADSLLRAPSSPGLDGYGSTSQRTGAPGAPDQIIFELGRKLQNVVVSPHNAGIYRSQVNQLLTLAARHQLDGSQLDGPASSAWPILLKATAWQESCWRQFVLNHGQVWYLESPSGDLGLMQVNKYVWRGFYSLNRLEWDIVYNAGAGADILMRLFADLPGRVGSVGPDATARSTYAAYNGGPDAYDRWRQPHEAQRLRAIDQAFWEKYRYTAEGRRFDILSCAAQWDRWHAD